MAVADTHTFERVSRRANIVDRPGAFQREAPEPPQGGALERSRLAIADRGAYAERIVETDSRKLGRRGSNQMEIAGG